MPPERHLCPDCYGVILISSLVPLWSAKPRALPSTHTQNLTPPPHWGATPHLDHCKELSHTLLVPVSCPSPASSWAQNKVQAYSLVCQVMRGSTKGFLPCNAGLLCPPWTPGRLHPLLLLLLPKGTALLWCPLLPTLCPHLRRNASLSPEQRLLVTHPNLSPLLPPPPAPSLTYLFACWVESKFHERDKAHLFNKLGGRKGRARSQLEAKA